MSNASVLSHSAEKRSVITYKPAQAFHRGWNQVAGMSVSEAGIEIDPDLYFIRFEQPTWSYVPWDVVQTAWHDIKETGTVALEQAALNFIVANRRITNDPSVVLRNADLVYSYLFDQARLSAFDDLSDVSANDLRVLRESSILCALNKVGLDGRITVIGPAWYFAQCARKVFGLDRVAEMRVDELFHGGFFNGARLSDQIKAHIALGGKLVHGCQGTGNGSGGCVVEYGTNVQRMQSELVALREPILRALDNIG